MLCGAIHALSVLGNCVVRTIYCRTVAPRPETISCGVDSVKANYTPLHGDRYIVAAKKGEPGGGIGRPGRHAQGKWAKFCGGKNWGICLKFSMCIIVSSSQHMITSSCSQGWWPAGGSITRTCICTRPHKPSRCRWRLQQELSYRKQIARQLRTQYVESINSNPVTLHSRLRVTQGHWKRNHWIDRTRLTISRVIRRLILS